MANMFVIHYVCHHTGVDVEISLNNLTGVVNSELMRRYAELDDRFHKVGMFLKWFVKKKRLFEKTAKLNSFSILSMLLVYMQDVKKILPNL